MKICHATLGSTGRSQSVFCLPSRYGACNGQRILPLLRCLDCCMPFTCHFMSPSPSVLPPIVGPLSSSTACPKQINFLSVSLRAFAIPLKLLTIFSLVGISAMVVLHYYLRPHEKERGLGSLLRSAQAALGDDVQATERELCYNVNWTGTKVGRGPWLL